LGGGEGMWRELFCQWWRRGRERREIALWGVLCCKGRGMEVGVKSPGTTGVSGMPGWKEAVFRASFEEGEDV